MEAATCELCDEGIQASSHCDECLMNLCVQCGQKHEKFSTKARGSHRVEKGICQYNMEIELCPVDGQKATFFCRTCLIRVCPECELRNKTHVMHPVVTLQQHIGNEKERLLEKLDEVTTKTEKISYFPQDIHRMSTHIELKWLERKESIRQEFASLLETIINQQEQLMSDMEQEVKSSLKELEELGRDHEDLLSTACQLSDDCISAVQNLPHRSFMQEYPQFLKSFGEMEEKVYRMPSVEQFMPAFLQIPFSLHKEKLHLHNSLMFKAFDCLKVKAKQHHVFIQKERRKDRVTIGDLVELPAPDLIPPSSQITYRAKVFLCAKFIKEFHSANKVSTRLSKRKLIFAGEDLSDADGVLGGFRLIPNSMYLVEISCDLTCTTFQGTTLIPGKTVSIILLTDVWKTKKAATVTQRQKPYSANAIWYNPIWPEHRDVAISCANVPQTGEKRACQARSEGSLLQCQVRYLKDCSFEEARLLEDKMLKIMTTKLPKT